MLSRIPLIGLVHRVNITRKTEINDGAGGIALGPDSIVYSNIRARITVMSNEDEQEGFGNISGQHWRVIVPYSPNIQRSDFLSLNSSSIAAPIPPGVNYRIIYVKHQVDDRGGIHHTSLIVELEDNDA